MTSKLWVCLKIGHPQILQIRWLIILPNRSISYYTISYYITVYPTFRHTSGRGKTTGLASSLAASRCPAVLEILRSPLVALHAAGQARKHVLLQASSRFLQPRAAILGARLAVGQFWLGLEDVRPINGIRWYKHV